MTVINKPIAGFFFVVIFPFFLLLGTAKFALLNPSFVFLSLQRSGEYAKVPARLAKAIPYNLNVPDDEKEQYAAAFAALPPVQIQHVVENNILNSYSYFNGDTRDLVITLPLSTFHIPRGEDITLSSHDLQGKTKEQIDSLYGVNQKLLVTLVVLAAVLLLLLCIAGRLVLLIVGGLTLLCGVAGKIFLVAVVTNNPMKEPMQVLLVFLSNSLLSDIAMSWMMVGAICIAVWFVLGFIKRKKKVVTKNVLSEGLLWRV